MLDGAGGGEAEAVISAALEEGWIVATVSGVEEDIGGSSARGTLGARQAGEQMLGRRRAREGG